MSFEYRSKARGKTRDIIIIVIITILSPKARVLASLSVVSRALRSLLEGLNYPNYVYIVLGYLLVILRGLSYLFNKIVYFPFHRTLITYFFDLVLL